MAPPAVASASTLTEAEQTAGNYFNVCSNSAAMAACNRAGGTETTGSAGKLIRHRIVIDPTNGGAAGTTPVSIGG